MKDFIIIACGAFAFGLFMGLAVLVSFVAVENVLL
jgi:hypothetical protein